PTTLLLAPSVEKRGGAPSAYAAVAGRGPVVLVDGKALDDFRRSADDLRDHALFAGVEPKDIKRLRVKVGGQTAVLERSGETDWKLLEPTKGSAKSARVDDLIYGVRALRWKQIVAPGGEEPAKYGLDAPTMEVVLLKGDGGELARLVVGRREGDRAYVRTGAGPAIYAVDPGTLGPPPKVPADLKGWWPRGGYSHHPMPREIFIVGRDRPDLYRYLSQTFSDAENVQVIWDRRAGERRAAAVTPHEPERRRADRRRRPAVDQELRNVGYAFITID